MYKHGQYMYKYNDPRATVVSLVTITISQCQTIDTGIYKPTSKSLEY